ncbi:cupin domain-containing protein [Actinoplanes sp. CA-030573]|uniref:cupin domain-containing protein n=1 Tax=Actinoplanes sp. CA-030573 TaxID=3239898 RepID=UPI003D8C214D
MNPRFATKQLAAPVDAVAPDGSQVRILVGLEAGGLAHFSLGPGATSVPVRHRTVSEIWYFVSGAGQMWRRQGDQEAVDDVRAGTSVTIPVGTAFQFRSTSGEALTAVGVTMPPWPGVGEAEILAEGAWTPTVEAGPA